MNYNDCLQLLGTKKRKSIYNQTYIERKDNFFLFRWHIYPFMEIFYDDTYIINISYPSIGIKKRIKLATGQMNVYLNRGYSVDINWAGQNGINYISCPRREVVIIKNGLRVHKEDMYKTEYQYYLQKLNNINNLGYIVNYLTENQPF